LWTEFVPFEKLPQVKNPSSGFIINCNNTPFRTTIGPDNPKPEGYSPTLGIDTLVTNRCLRALELFGGDDSITEEEFYKYKFDTSYSTSKESMSNEILNKIFEAPASDDPVVQEAVKLLHTWDGHTNVENTGAAIAILTLEPVVRAEFMHNTPPDLMETLSKRAHLLKDTYGRIDVPWGEVNRIVRGKVDMGLAGGPDVLHAVYGKLEGSRLIGEAGDSYVLIVSWDKAGKVSSRSLHQFGSATLDETSPHYADQVPMFVKCETKPVWLDEADIRAHLEREYRPGEEVKAPADVPAKATLPTI
jgi:penicillin amidase/acyl-homoserine-lactone acylase